MDEQADNELQAWLDEGTERLAQEEAERKARHRLAPKWTWAEVQFNFKRELYRKAIGA